MFRMNGGYICRDSAICINVTMYVGVCAIVYVCMNECELVNMLLI